MDPSKNFVDLMANYNADILDNFVKDCNFDMDDYFTKVYIFNCDVWGICSTFFKFLTNREYLSKLSPDLNALALENYYKIIFKICFEKGNEKINIDELIILLIPISDSNERLAIVSDEPESTPLNTKEEQVKSNQISEFQSNYNMISKSTKSAVKDIARIASSAVEKTIGFKPKSNKTKKKRCPNGSRRNKKSKKCVIYSGVNKGQIVQSTR